MVYLCEASWGDTTPLHTLKPSSLNKSADSKSRVGNSCE